MLQKEAKSVQGDKQRGQLTQMLILDPTVSLQGLKGSLLCSDWPYMVQNDASGMQRAQKASLPAGSYWGPELTLTSLRGWSATQLTASCGPERVHSVDKTPLLASLYT